MRRLGSRLILSEIGLPDSRESKVKKERFRCTGSGERVPCHGGRVRCSVCSRLLDGYHPRWEYKVKEFRMRRHATVRVHFIKTDKLAPKVNDIHSARLRSPPAHRSSRGRSNFGCAAIRSALVRRTECSHLRQNLEVRLRSHCPVGKRNVTPLSVGL